MARCKFLRRYRVHVFGTVRIPFEIFAYTMREAAVHGSATADQEFCSLRNQSRLAEYADELTNICVDELSSLETDSAEFYRATEWLTPRDRVELSFVRSFLDWYDKYKPATSPELEKLVELARKQLSTTV